MSRPRETTLRLCGKGARFALSCLGSLTLWAVWLALGFLAGAQGLILLHHEVPVPEWVLRRLEARVVPAGVLVTTGHVRFDPTGWVLIADASLLLDTPREAMLTARAISLQVDPVLAIAGQIEVETLQLAGGQLWLPAMFSPRGEREAVLEDVDGTIRFTADRIYLLHLTARIGDVRLSLSGEFDRPRPAGVRPAGLPAIGTLIRTHYLPLARRLAAARPQLARLEDPVVVIDVRPGPAGGHATDFEIQATHLTWPLTGPLAGDLRLTQPAVRGAVVLGAGAPRGPLRVTAASAELPPDLRVVRPALELDATAVGAWREGRVPTLELAAGSVAFREWTIAAPQLALTAASANHAAADATGTPGPTAAPRAALRLVASDQDRALLLTAELEVPTRAGHLELEGPLPLRWIDAALATRGRELAGVLDFAGTPRLHGTLDLGPGGQPERARVRLASGGSLVARRVAIDDASGVMTWEGTALRADDVELLAGESHATGAYTMDTRTLEHRFLLSGQLRPLHIGGWFSGWWPRLWADFEFPGPVPTANIDIRGRWGAPRETVLWVGVDTRDPIVRSVPLERAQLQVFVRPGFFHVVDLFAERPEGEARGWFSRSYDEAKRDWRRMELDLRSTFTTAAVTALAGSWAEAIAAPLGFDSPPALHAQGWAEGPAADHGVDHDIHFTANSRGPFRLVGFPLETVTLRGHSTPELLELREIDARFAGGKVSGQADLTGDPDETKRRLAFDLGLEGAEFTRAARILAEYLAARRGETAKEESDFMKRASGGRIDLTATAEGSYLDTFSYEGAGIATLTGTNLGEINLLGRLSQLLRGTFLGSLDLGEAQSRFRIARDRLEFHQVRIAGRSAVIEARGTYQLPDDRLDFAAKVAPFREAGIGLGSIFGLVLTPFTKVLEVRLDGTLEQPNWHLALGSSDPSKAIAPDTAAPPSTPPPATPLAPKPAAPAPRPGP